MKRILIFALLIGIACTVTWAWNADFNGNGVVDFDDFFLYVDHFGTTSESPNWDPTYSLDGDVDVDFDDFFLFVDQFGQTIEPTLYQGMAVTRTDNPRVPIVAAHEEGTQIAILADESGSRIEGAVFTQEDGKRFYISLGDDGLPERVHAEGYTFLFENYTDSTVDIAVVAPDGTSQIFREIAVNSEEVQALKELALTPSAKVAALQEEGFTLWKAVKFGLLAASIASCAIAVVSTSGVLLPAIAVPCGKAIIGVGLALAPVINPELENTSGAIGTTVAVVGCVTGEDVTDCVDLIVDIGEIVSGQAETDMAELEEEITAAHGSLVVVPTVTVDLSGGAQMEFVWIEPGSFMMGSPDSEEGRGDFEGPQHEVTISRGFYLGRYEITQGQWEAVMGTSPWSGKSYVQANPTHPAVFISWKDMQAFVHALNEAAGDSLYRLPTEAEWEYSCRAGTTTRWSFGDDESQLEDYAWYDANAWSIGEKYAHAVGTKLSNPWGLYDMYGNCWEWVQDWYGDYSSDNQVDPTGPAGGSYRVARGGGFVNGARYARSAIRGNGTPARRYDYFGVRLLRTR